MHFYPTLHTEYVYMCMYIYIKKVINSFFQIIESYYRCLSSDKKVLDSFLLSNGFICVVFETEIFVPFCHFCWGNMDVLCVCILGT